MHTAKSPGEQAVWTYVVDDPDTRAITDFASFYLIEHQVLNGIVAKELRIAYLSYCASEHAFNQEEEGLKERLVTLIKDVMILAKAVRGLGFTFIS